jgi:hypothetical protein
VRDAVKGVLITPVHEEFKVLPNGACSAFGTVRVKNASRGYAELNARASCQIPENFYLELNTLLTCDNRNLAKSIKKEGHMKVVLTTATFVTLLATAALA